MAATAISPNVAQLRADAQAKADEAAQFFEGLTPAQGATTTEIGWTVAATAGHLASGTGFAKQQLTQFKSGRVLRVPGFVINTANFITSRSSKKRSFADSATKLRAGTTACLRLLDDWSDAELARPFEKPYFRANTYGEALRYTLVGHIDEHMGQIKRALKIA